MRGRLRVFFAALLVALGLPAAAAAQWLPHAADATWTYEWTDSVYSPTPTKEKVTVKSQAGRAFTLEWTSQDQGNPDGATTTLGTMDFQAANVGLLNTNWSSNPPPQAFPVLCARLVGCGNALHSTLYVLIWGTRAPVLAEPLLRGVSWTSTGGADNSVSSASSYVGQEQITVPAFPGPVAAAKVRTEITQAGALGDPYGSGVRTVWWVYGVGPVRIVFEHAGGSGAPVTTAVLRSTNQQPKTAPSDANYFPLERGKKLRYRWRNSRHLRTASVQEFVVDEVVNGSARISVKHISGPIRVAGAYGFATRLDGVTNVWGFTRAATRVVFPALGPRSLPADRRRRFFTPFDLMNFGLNPIVSAYPAAGETWRVARPGRDFSVYGATGSSRIAGVERVRVPAGTFRALAVRTSLRQPGFPFGSGTRTSYFAPGKGLVKLVFRHGDRSISTVELLR